MSRMDWRTCPYAHAVQGAVYTWTWCGRDAAGVDTFVVVDATGAGVGVFYRRPLVGYATDAARWTARQSWEYADSPAFAAPVWTQVLEAVQAVVPAAARA